MHECLTLLAASSSKLQTLLQYTDPLSTPVANPRLATGPTQRITVGVLPAAGFMNGHTYFVQGLHKVRRRCRPLHAAEHRLQDRA